MEFYFYENVAAFIRRLVFVIYFLLIILKIKLSKSSISSLD